MKKITRIYPLFFGFIGLFWVSCSNRKDYIASLDIKPNIYIKVGDSLLKRYQDSVKINSILNGFSSIDLNFNGQQGITSLRFNQKGTLGLIKYKADTIKNNILNAVNGEIILKYIPISPGLMEYHFLVSDKFQGLDSCIYKVLSFKNLSPVAKCTVYASKIIDPLEYTLDASSSFDQDQHFGGGILKYLFFVNGQSIQTTNPSIKYIFPSAGQYTVSVQVVDNDQATSNLFTITQLIN